MLAYDPHVEQLIRRLAERPEPYAAGDAQLWTDPVVAPQLLAAHLDPITDAASRRPETIAREVEWLAVTLELRPGVRVLDLGCGPGLYCEALAARGLTVTGVDASAGSLEYARREADGAAARAKRAGHTTAGVVELGRLRRGVPGFGKAPPRSGVVALRLRTASGDGRNLAVRKPAARDRRAVSDRLSQPGA